MAAKQNELKKETASKPEDRAGRAGFEREPTVQPEPKETFAERTAKAIAYVDEDGKENRGDVVERKARVQK